MIDGSDVRESQTQHPVAIYPASGFVYNMADKAAPGAGTTTVISSGSTTGGTPQQTTP